MNNKKEISVVWQLFCACAMIFFIFSHFSKIANAEILKSAEFREKKTSSFEIKDKSITEAVNKLSEEAKVLCCHEYMPENYTQWWEQTNGIKRKLSVTINDMTPKEILDKFAALSDNTWYWEECQGVVNIIPKERKGAEDYLLNKMVASFRVEDKKFSDAIFLLGKQTGEKQKIAVIDRWGKDQSLVNIDVENTTVRQILDIMTKQTGRVWIYDGKNRFVLLGRPAWFHKAYTASEKLIGDVSRQTTNQTAVVVPGTVKTNDLGTAGNIGNP